MTSPANPATSGTDRTGVTSYTTPTEQDIVATRVFAAPRDLVFRAFTVPKHVRQWLLGPDGWTMPVCEIDLRAGGAWRYVWRQDHTGQEFFISGSYVEVTPPERLVHIERMNGEPPESINTTDFTESGGQTVVVLTMRYSSREVRDAVMATGMSKGLDRSFERLDATLGAE
jgi:uncharacterized protein YndB with AHSA1/START domain